MASFVIVALIWVPSRRLSVLISFLIAMPIVYAGVLDGIRSADPQLIEMARIFRMTPFNRLAYLYLPSILPRFATSAGVAIGLAWKSGVAAEVIGIPGGSIGEKLYRAKIYLATPDLFAWTLTIVALSVLCERAIRALLVLAQRRMEGEVSAMAIQLCEVSKSFDGKPVLVNLSHSFPDGGISCVLGPSGCGKTTLLRILMGLLEPDSGRILGLPGRCSAVFQEDRLIEHASALANVRIALKRDFPAGRIAEALSAVGLADAMAQPVRELSGGMKRRVAIVRALLSDAPLLLMDEPFRGLDRATRERVIGLFAPADGGPHGNRRHARS